MFPFRIAVQARVAEPAHAPTPAIELDDMPPRVARPAPVVFPPEHYDGFVDGFLANGENRWGQTAQPTDGCGRSVRVTIVRVLLVGFLVLVCVGMVIFLVYNFNMS